MNWEGYLEDLKSFEQHSVAEFNLKWTTVQAEWGKTCGEKGYNPVAESYNREFLEVSVRAQSVLLCEPTSIRARVYMSSLNSHSAGIYIGTRYGEFSKQEERLHHAVFFQLLMKSSPGDAESSRSFALVAACRFEGLQDGYLFHFLQG